MLRAMTGPPTGFEEIHRPPWTVWLRAPVAEALVDALCGTRPALDGALDLGGRGAVWRVPINGGEAVVRRYRRGGLIRRFVRDHYRVNRPLREFRIHHALETLGAPVPHLLAAAWRVDRGWYRGAIATAYVAAPTLLDVASEAADDVLCACGKAIRTVHDAGVYHADLNAANVLLAPEGPLLIDFDNASRRTKLGALARQQNLLRLRRSLEKHDAPSSVFETIREGYGALAFASWLDTLYRCRGLLSDRLGGRST